MKKAFINKIVDTNYKDGFVSCKCGYKKDLGDGFNQYHIDNCPSCTKELETRQQRKVVFYDEDEKRLKAEVGTNIYFVLSNGIHVRFEKVINQTYYGSERYLDNI